MEFGVLGPLTALTNEHPFRERLWAQHMLALYRCGRRADALRAYLTARDVLVEETGLDPGQKLRDLHQAILGEDPAATTGAREYQVATGAGPRMLPPALGDFTGQCSRPVFSSICSIPACTTAMIFPPRSARESTRSRWPAVSTTRICWPAC